MHLTLIWWVLVVVLILVGLAGTLLPLLPGAVLILAGAFLYQWGIAAPGHELGWITLTGLTVLTVLSYVVDLVSAVWGAKKFGASKAGMWGGLLGLIVGLFFNLPGLILGPPIGVVCGELSVGKQLPEAFRIAWGTVVGTAAGMAIRFLIALLMVGWLVVVLFRVAG